MFNNNQNDNDYYLLNNLSDKNLRFIIFFFVYIFISSIIISIFVKTYDEFDLRNYDKKYYSTF